MVSLLIGFLPTGHLSSSFTSALTQLWGIINTFSYLIPVDTLLTLVGLVIAFDIAVLLWRVVNWVIRKIPGMQ